MSLSRFAEDGSKLPAESGSCGCFISSFFPFSQQGNQSFGLEAFSWVCKERCPSVPKLTWLQFPNQRPVSKGNPPDNTPCSGFPGAESPLGLLVFEMLPSKLQLGERRRAANWQAANILHRANAHMR